MAVKVGINGFGRIGRLVFRAAMNDSDIDIVSTNDITDPKTLAHLLKYDSVHGVLKADVKATDNGIVVNGKEVKVTAIKDPAELPWKDLGVDIVLESTGLFTKREAAAKHITAGAKKVIISAPSKDPDVTIVIGVNDGDYNPTKHNVLSNASCTTNCLGPICKVLVENFGVEYGLMTTIHSYTNDQRILDLPHKDLRRARAAALNMIPTTTGAAAAIGLVIPELKGKMDGLAIRVPTPNVSLVDLVAKLKKDVTKDDLVAAFKVAAEGPLKGIMELCMEPLVSGDFNGTTVSSIVDGLSFYVTGGSLAKVLGWYDNEYGYSSRCVDLIKLMASKM